jgi:hypothetical protein
MRMRRPSHGFFEVFAPRQYSLKALAAKGRAEGWTIRGRGLQKSTLRQIVRKRIYSGDFDWDGVTYKGSHQALVHVETRQTVQTLLDNRVIGLLAWSSGSLVPCIIGHVIMDIGLFAYWCGPGSPASSRYDR